MTTKFANRAARAAWWSAIEIGSRSGLQFVVTIILARLLVPADFGLVALLVIFTSIGATLVDGGFGTALIQRQQTTPDDETTVFAFSAVVGVLAFVALYLAAPTIAGFFHDLPMAHLLRVTAIVLVFAGFGAVPDALLTLRLDFRARALAQAAASIISGAAAIMLAVAGYGAWSLVCQLVIAAAIRVLALWGLAHWWPRGHFSQKSFTSLGSYGAFMLLSGTLYTVYIQMQSLLIGKLFDTRELGYFSVAQNSQQAPATVLGAILSRVGLPVLASFAGDPARLRDALRPILRLSMFLFVPCMVGIAVLSRPLIVLIYGPQWLPAAPILTILAVAGSLWPLHVLNQEALNAYGRPDLFFRIVVIKIVIAIVLVIAASPWGPIGIAWAALFSSLLSVGVGTFYAGRLFHYGLLQQAREQIPTLVLASAAALVGWIALYVMGNRPAVVPSAIALAAFTYLGLAKLFRTEALCNLFTFVTALRNDALKQTPPNG